MATISIMFLATVAQAGHGWINSRLYNDTAVPVSTTGFYAVNAGGTETQIGSYQSGAVAGGFTDLYPPPGTIYEDTAGVPSDTVAVRAKGIYTGSGSGSWYYDTPYTFGQSGGYYNIHVLTYPWSAPAACTTNISFTVHNNNPWAETYCIIYKDGTVQGTPAYCPAGFTLTLAVTAACTNRFDFGVWRQPSGEEIESGDTNYKLITTNAIGYSGTVTNAGQKITTNPTNAVAQSVTAPPFIYNTTNNNGTNYTPPIIFSTTNQVTSQQQGDQALYDALTKFAAKNNSQNLILASNLSAINTNISAKTNYSLETTQSKILSANNGMSNLLSSIVLRGADQATHLDSVAMLGALNSISNNTKGTTGISNYAQETTLLGMSNLMVNGNYATNRPIGTNDWGTAQSNLTAQLDAIHNETNGAGVMGTAMSGYKSQINQTGVSDDAANNGSLFSVELGGAGGGLQFQITSNDLDARVGSLSQGRPVFKWAIIVLLVFFNYKVLRKAIGDVAQTNQATTAGTTLLGTNVNSASALICAAIIVAILASLPTIAASGILDVLTTISFHENPIASVTSNIYAFGNHYFPIGLMFSALINHFGFRVFLDAAAASAMAIVKFLVGV